MSLGTRRWAIINAAQQRSAEQQSAMQHNATYGGTRSNRDVVCLKNNILNIKYYAKYLMENIKTTRRTDLARRN